MSSTQKKNKANGKELRAIVDADVANYEKHPFFIRKAKEAKTLLKKTGLLRNQAAKK